MPIADNLADLLNNGLTSLDSSSLARLNEALLSPCNFTWIAQEIRHDHLAFALCQAIKQNIRERNACSYLSEPDERATLEVKASEMQKIAQFNPFLSHLKQIASEPKYFRQKSLKSSYLNISSNGSFDIFNLISADNFKAEYIFYESINYFYLLLSSLKMHYEVSAISEEEAQWKHGLLKIRDEVIAKLIVQILANNQGDHEKVNLEVCLKYVESFLPQNAEMICQRMVNIIHEAIYYLSNEISGYEQMKMLQRHGENILAFIISLFQKITNYPMNFFHIVATMIQSTYDLLVMAFMDGEKVGFEEDTFEIAEEEIVPSWFRKFNLDLIQMLEKTVEIVNALGNDFNQGQILEKILALMRMLSKNEIFDDFSCSFSPIKENARGDLVLQKIFNLLGQIIKISVQRLSTYSFQTKDQSNFYLQYILSKTALQICSSHSKTAMNQRTLLIFILQNYFPLILEKISIQISNGKGNPVSMVSIFVLKMFNYFGKDHYLMTLVENIVNLMLNKCSTEPASEEFSSFNEEFEASSEYFSSFVKLLQKFTAKTCYQSSRSFVSLLRQLIQKIFMDGQTTSHYLLRLSIELIRDMKNSSFESYREQICSFSMYLLQNLRYTMYKDEYLMFLDSISNLIIEEESQDLNSEFWYHTKKNVQFSLASFVGSIASQLINLLLSNKSDYYVSSVIDMLSRTYKRFKEINPQELAGELSGKITDEMSDGDIRKLNELMRIYFQPIYSFVEDIDISILRDLKHYVSRKKIFQLIGVLGIYSPRDVYSIYNKFILTKHDLKSERGIIYFFIDTSGLLESDIEQNYKHIFMELMILQLEANQHVFDLFTLQNLKNNELIFEIFISFFENFLGCWVQISHEVYYTCRKIKNKLSDKMKLLSRLYNEQNAPDLSKIYQSFSKLTKFKISLPDLPPKIYNLSEIYSTEFFRRYLKKMEKQPDPQQFLIFYQNVFERKRIEWTFQEKQENMDRQITSTPEKIEILLYLCDFREITGISVNIDHEKLIKDLAVLLLKEFVDRYSISSVDIGSIDDTDNEDDPINYVQEFFKSDSKKYIFKLARVQYNFNELSCLSQVDYCLFEPNFLQTIKCLFYCQKIHKK